MVMVTVRLRLRVKGRIRVMICVRISVRPRRSVRGGGVSSVSGDIPGVHMIPSRVVGNVGQQVPGGD